MGIILEDDSYACEQFSSGFMIYGSHPLLLIQNHFLCVACGIELGPTCGNGAYGQPVLDFQEW